MRLILALLLLPMACIGQTATVPPLTSQLPAVVDPGWTIKCPINGKTATCTQVQRTLLKASQITTPQTVVPVNLSGTSITLNCPNVTVSTDATGTHYNLGSCTAVAK